MEHFHMILAILGICLVLLEPRAVAVLEECYVNIIQTTLFARNKHLKKNGYSLPPTPISTILQDTPANATGEMDGSETKTSMTEDVSIATLSTLTVLNALMMDLIN